MKFLRMYVITFLQSTELMEKIHVVKVVGKLDIKMVGGMGGFLGKKNRTMQTKMQGYREAGLYFGMFCANFQ